MRWYSGCCVELIRDPAILELPHHGHRPGQATPEFQPVPPFPVETSLTYVEVLIWVVKIGFRGSVKVLQRWEMGAITAARRGCVTTASDSWRSFLPGMLDHGTGVRLFGTLSRVHAKV